MTNSDPIIKILYIEDNDFDAFYYQSLLEKDQNYQFSVEITGTLYDAIDTLKIGSKFDLILVDLNLPDSSGLDTLTSLIHTVGNLMPIYAVSGISDQSTIDNAYSIGAVGFVRKGKNDKNLASNIQETIKRFSLKN